MKRYVLAAIAGVALSGPAWGQSSPGWVTGQVPTAAQWNNAFAGKADYPVTGTGCPTCVIGPASATDNAVALFNGVTGKLLKNSSSLLPIRKSLQDFGACSSYSTCGGQDDTVAIQAAWTWAATGVGGLDIIDIGGCYAVTGNITALNVAGPFTARGIGQPCIADSGTGAATLSVGTLTQVVSGAVNNGSGLIRLTVGSTANYTTGQTKLVGSVGGTTEANATWTVTVVDATHIDLQGSTFTNAYTSGGVVVTPSTANVIIENVRLSTSTQTNGLRINGMGYGVVSNMDISGYSGIGIYADATYTMKFEKPRLLSNGTGIKFLNGGANSASVENGVINGHTNCGVEYDATDHFRPSILWSNLESNLRAICIGGANPVISGNEFEGNTTDIYAPTNGGVHRRGIVISGNGAISTTFITATEIDGFMFVGNRIQHGAGGSTGTLTTITAMFFCSNDITGGSTITAPWGRALGSGDCANNTNSQRFVGYLEGFDGSDNAKFQFTNDGGGSYINSPFVVGATDGSGVGTLDVRGAGKFTGQITSTVSTGTAPFVIASTTAVANLHAASADAVAVGGITGLGTGVATALGINTGSAGSFVVNGGAGIFTTVAVNATIGANQTSTGVVDFRIGAVRLMSWGAAATQGQIEFWQGQGASAVAKTMWLDTTNSLNLDAKIFAPNLATTSAALAAALCWTATTGEFQRDTNAGGCLVSAAKFKQNVEPLRDSLDTVMSLKPVSFDYKPEVGINGRQIGFIADQAAKVDERLIGRDDEGNVHSFKYMQYVAHLTGAIQQLKADNDNLRQRIELLERK